MSQRRDRQTVVGAALLALALFGAVHTVAPAPMPAPSPAPRAEVQEAIAQLVATERAAISGAPQPDGGSAAGPSPAALASLEELAGGRPALLKELLLYLAVAPSTETAMPGAVLLQRFEFTVAEKVEAAVPLLLVAEDATVRAARSLLATVDRAAGPDVDFAPYLPHLRDRDAETTRDLAAYMMETDPEAALTTLRTALGPPDARSWAEAPFARLATDPNWWVRLYAAALAARHPDLATSAAGQALANDPIPQVRRLLSAMEAADTAR